MRRERCASRLYLVSPVPKASLFQSFHYRLQGMQQPICAPPVVGCHPRSAAGSSPLAARVPYGPMCRDGRPAVAVDHRASGSCSMRLRFAAGMSAIGKVRC